jgi:hypothetical protein
MSHDIPMKFQNLLSAWEAIQNKLSAAQQSEQPVELAEFEKDQSAANRCFAELMTACEQWFR